VVGDACHAAQPVRARGDETVRTLRTIAERLGKPQSMVVREAVAEMALGQAA
jgi:predicted transcriptional regulator